jgi:hypothetical protein
MGDNLTVKLTKFEGQGYFSSNPRTYAKIYIRLISASLYFDAPCFILIPTSFFTLFLK